jgi:hypothetical protein
MIARLLLLAAALLAAVPATAADRSVAIGSFSRVRVQGPFQVVIAATHAPAATISGDAATIEAADVAVEGDTLTVRSRMGRWEEQPHGSATRPAVVTLGTDRLIAATVIGGGRISAARMAGPRADLSVTGAGAISVAALDADAVNATLIGNGAISIAGRAAQARLMTNGAGTIDAGGLDAGDLVVRLDGPGTITAQARYTARVTNTGIGQVAVAGSPKCTVLANAGGPVACGR